MFIAIGKSEFSTSNLKWTENNDIPVIVDDLPYDIWTSWDVDRWDIFILDSEGELYETFNIYDWQENRILNAINGLLPNLENKHIPDKYELLEVVPNPFNPSTNIFFSVKEYSDVQLTLLNIMGQELEVLNRNYLIPGNYQVKLDAENYSSGIYFISLKTNSIITSQKIILSK